MRLLTSRNNPVIKTIRLVAEQARRAPAGLVLAEGVRVLEEATRSGLPLEAAVISEHFGNAPREQKLLKLWDASDTRVYLAGPDLHRYLSDVVSPQGAIALVRVPRRRLDEVPLPRDPLLLCACEVQDPGNLGSLIRSAAAAGASMVCTTPGTVSARNAKCIRSSAGAFFRIPIVEHVQPAAILDYCRSRSIRVFRSAASTGTEFGRTGFAGGTALLLGNEAKGIDAAHWAGIPAVCIPMAPGAESLNVAAAGAVLLFEAFRQRSEGNPDRSR